MSPATSTELQERIIYWFYNLNLPVNEIVSLSGRSQSTVEFNYSRQLLMFVVLMSAVSLFGCQGCCGVQLVRAVVQVLGT